MLPICSYSVRAIKLNITKLCNIFNMTKYISAVYVHRDITTCVLNSLREKQSVTSSRFSTRAPEITYESVDLLYQHVNAQ